MKPSNFIIHSDFASLKNDARGRLSVTIPSGNTIPALGERTWSTDLVIGTINAPIRSQMESTLFPGVWTLGTSRVIDLLISTGGPSSPETNMVSVVRINPTTVRIYTTYYNPSASIATVNNTQTVTADIVTFLSPFN